MTGHFASVLKSEFTLIDLSRRNFIKTAGAALGAAGLAGTAFAPHTASAAAPLKELRVLQIGVGGIGGYDRGQIANHPKARIVGLCDVDKNNLDNVGKKFPEAFREVDYRKIFADRKDEFDAVNVCTPDLHHAPQMITALAHSKHVYGQKPLVHQLEELTLLKQAIDANPHLATQTGNQRMDAPGRRIAVDILKRDLLGPAVEAWVWTNTKRGSDTKKNLPGEKPPPPHLDWDMWLGPAEKQPYRDGIAPGSWRAWWDFGTGGMGDWGVHLLDLIMYGYPELVSPVAVQTNTPRAADWFHSAHCQSTLTYEVNSPRFKRSIFPIHYSDVGMVPSLRSLGINKEDDVDKNSTCVVCEEGTMLLSANGGLEIYRGGKRVDVSSVGEIPDPGPSSHWHSWVDQALGIKDHLKVWTPFDVGIRITEAAILPGKASRFPKQELHWDHKKLAFTNHQEATDTIIRRKYRDGFAPPKIN